MILPILLAATILAHPMPTARAGTLAKEEASARPDQTNIGTSGPLYVYILAGQSNMQGHANVSTIPSMEADPHSRAMYRSIIGSNGKPIVYKNVWVASIGCGGNQYSDMLEKTGNLTTGFGASETEIGPELLFGITIERRLHHPVLIIKTSWGGRSLMTDFRPPMAGPRIYSDDLKKEWARRGMNVAQTIDQTNAATGAMYRNMMDYIHSVLGNIKRIDPDYNPAEGYKLAGFVWFQGWNDMVDRDAYPDCMKAGGYSDYTKLEENLIDNVRHDLGAPGLPVVIGVMGVDGVKEGAKPPQGNFREAQIEGTELPRYTGNVLAVPTAEFWDDKLAALQQRQQSFNDQFSKWLGSNSRLSESAQKQARDRQLAAAFTPDEIKAMAGISNYGFHYLGSAKILCSIGQALGQAMLKLDSQGQKIESK